MGDYAVTTPLQFLRQERSSSCRIRGWDHALKVTGDGEGLVGHAGAVLLRKLADQAGLTAALGLRWSGPGSSRWWTGLPRLILTR